jgi:hypothetical protein
MDNDSFCKPALNRRQVLALLAGFGISADALAQDAARTDPRSYRVVFENDRVRVLEYVSRPGLGICGQGIHTHPAHLTIPLTEAKAKITLLDGKVIFDHKKAGDMFWEPDVKHKVENIGGSGVSAYLVEMKDKAWQPSTG